MDAVGTGLGGGTETDDGLELNDGGTGGLGIGGLDGLFNGVDVGAVTVDLDDVPVVGLEASGHVFGKGDGGTAVDGNTIVVIEQDEVVQSQVTGQGAGLVRNALFQAAVTVNDVDIVIEEVVTFFVELGGQVLLGNGHAHAVAEALAQGTGGHFDTEVQIELGVTGGLRAPLTELLEIVEAEVVAAEVEHAVDEHAAVARGQDETIAIEPAGIGGVMLHDPGKQGVSRGGHTHGHAGVATLGGLNAFSR